MAFPLPRLVPPASTLRQLVGATAVAGMALAGAVWASQQGSVEARACELQAASCARRQGSAEELNTRLLQERHSAAAEHARALAAVNEGWEEKVTAVQLAWARTESQWRADHERKVAEQVRVLVEAPAAAGEAEVEPVFTPLQEYVVRSEGDHLALVDALASNETLERENEALVEQLWLVRMERDDARDRLGRIGELVEKERAARLEALYGSFESGARWTVCGDLPRAQRDECATQVVVAARGARARFQECLRESSEVPELTSTRNGVDVPTYWRKMWSDESTTWWVALCDLKLPEAGERRR